MSTGDLKNNLRKLQLQLKKIKYTDGEIDQIATGAPGSFLPIYHYLLVDYSTPVAHQILTDFDSNLFAKTDAKFIDALYKVMRDMFSYKPPITKDQFFSAGYVEKKVIMATEVIERVHCLHMKLAPKSNNTKVQKSFSGSSGYLHDPLGDVSTASKPSEDLNKSERSYSSNFLKKPASHTSLYTSPIMRKVPPKRLAAAEPELRPKIVKEIGNPEENAAPMPHKGDFKPLKPESTRKAKVISVACNEVPKSMSGLNFNEKNVRVGMQLSKMGAQIRKLQETVAHFESKFSDMESKFSDMESKIGQQENTLARITLLENRLAMVSAARENNAASTDSFTDPVQPATPTILQGVQYVPEIPELQAPLSPEPPLSPQTPLSPEPQTAPLSPIDIVAKDDDQQLFSPEVTMNNTGDLLDDHSSKSCSTPEGSESASFDLENLDGQQKSQAWKIMTIIKSTKDMLSFEKKGDKNNNNNDDDTIGNTDGEDVSATEDGVGGDDNKTDGGIEDGTEYGPTELQCN